MATIAGRRRSRIEIERAMPQHVVVETLSSHPSSCCDGDHGGMESSSKERQQTTRVRRIRRKKTSLRTLRKIFPSAKAFLDTIDSSQNSVKQLLFGIGFVLTFFVFVRTFIMYPTDSFEARSVKSDTAFRRNAILYNQTYTIAMNRLKPPDLVQWPQYTKRPFELRSVYERSVVGTCGLTVVVMEAKLGAPKYDFGPGQPLWFALESLAAYSPRDVCVTLITTTCAMRVYMEEGLPGEGGVEDHQVQEAIREGIYEHSLPLFRRLIESGRVRLTFVDNFKYNLNSCTDFSSSNNALFHRSFWEDEFEERDGDLVMIFQADSVLCYPLVTEPFAEYAFVASVWPKANNPLVPESLEGPCREMPASWHSWLRPQRMMKRQLEEQSSKDGQTSELGPTFLNEEFPRVCEKGRGPMGSGGLSLRSRRWMIKAIETCPHVKYSGLNVDNDQKMVLCKVFDLVKEDFYFGTILQGINAPLPSPYTATLFSSEAFWPNQVLEVYPSSNVLQDEKPSSDRNCGTRPAISFFDSDEQMDVPNAMYRVWWYHPEELIRSVMSDFCPFLPFIHTSDMYRNDEYMKKREEWIGIGT